MLTPQEVADHAFAKASFGGYNMAMVDEFLDVLTADYTALYKENAALKAKMKVLADKVDEYRSTEEAMRKALVAAQRVADQMVSEAEEQKSAILAAAKKEIGDKVITLRQNTASEQARLTALQNATSDYISKLKDLCRHEMEYLSSLSQATAATAPFAAAPDPVGEAADAAAAAVERQMQQEMPTERPPRERESLYQELMRSPGRLHRITEATPGGEKDGQD